MELDTVDSEPGKIVIVESGSGQVGVMVDEVEEVLTTDEAQIDAMPTVGAACIEGIAKLGDRLVVLLDPDGIFAGVELAGCGARA